MNIAVSSMQSSGRMASLRKDLQLDCAPAAIAERLCAMGQQVELARGEELSGGIAEDRLVYIAKGAAKLVASSGENHNQVLAFYFAGDVASVLSHHGEESRLIALTRLHLISFPSGEFLDQAQEAPEVLRTVLTRSLQALHRSREKMMQLGNRSARLRVVDFLLSMAERTGARKSGNCKLQLPMSRRDIADSLCLTIETVSRQFTELRELGLIETEGRSGVVLRKLPELAALATTKEENSKEHEI